MIHNRIMRCRLRVKQFNFLSSRVSTVKKNTFKNILWTKITKIIRNDDMFR